MKLPDTMNALILKNDGLSKTRTSSSIDTLEPYLEYGQLPVPRPGPGEVLIRVAMASVNPSDLFFIKGEYGQPRRKGAAAGFEGVGEVVSANGLYSRLLMGKRVAFVGGVQGSGAWAEYIVAKAAMCIPVRKAMRDEDAAGHTVNPVSAFLMFEKVRESGSKSFILTGASSQLGKLMIGLARDSGFKAIAIVRNAKHISHLKELGAAHVVVNSEPDAIEIMAKLCREEKPRLLVDSVADQFSADTFDAMQTRATWMIYGRMSDEQPAIREPGQFIFMDKKIVGFWLASWFRKATLIEKLKTIRTVQNRFISGAWKTEVGRKIALGDAMGELPAALREVSGQVMILP